MSYRDLNQRHSMSNNKMLPSALTSTNFGELYWFWRVSKPNWEAPSLLFQLFCVVVTLFSPFMSCSNGWNILSNEFWNLSWFFSMLPWYFATVFVDSCGLTWLCDFQRRGTFTGNVLWKQVSIQSANGTICSAHVHNGVSLTLLWKKRFWLIDWTIDSP